MKILVITSPGFMPGEDFYIQKLLDWRVDLIHLRKPDATIEACETLLRAIPIKYHDRIVVHDHFELCDEFHLHGIHLNSRNHTPPQKFQGSISCSCHSIEEVAERKAKMNYVFLSPIFNSISKQGYKAAYTKDSLKDAAAMGIIDKKVIALGGITFGKLKQLEKWHFGGVAMLGAIWNHIDDILKMELPHEERIKKY